MEHPLFCSLPVVATGISSALCIVSDVEHCSHRPGNPVSQWQTVLAGLSCPAVLESLFPEVRTLAYLSAAGAPLQRADWLAARVLVFSLQHLELSADELFLMDAVNLRLARLSRKLACECPQLRSFALFAGARALRTHGQSRHILSRRQSLVDQSLALRTQLGDHLAALRQAMLPTQA